MKGSTSPMPNAKYGSLIIANLFRIFLLLFILLAGHANAETKQTIAVLDFESIGSEEHLGKAVSEIMRTELIDANRYRVVERAQINKAISEQKLQKSGLIDDKSAVELGKILGADLIVIGSVVKIGTSYTINSRMIDTKTGEAKLGKNVTGNDLNLLTALSRNLLDNLFGSIRKDRKPEIDESMKGGAKTDLRILKALYGSGKVQMDVTENLKQRISNGQLAVNVSNEIFGSDPIQGVWKALIVRYETDQGEFGAYTEEGRNLLIPSPFDTKITIRSTGLLILEAWYGQANNHVDVKSAIQNRIIGGAVVVRASNLFFGVDPIVGVRKTFFVRYRNQDGTFEATAAEDQDMVIPDLRHHKMMSR
jgi:TolB-like protein